MAKFFVKLWLYSMAVLPFPLLYLLSDLLFFVAYHLLKYRRKVVEDNLRHAFPELTEEERQRISRRFFKDLADLVLETIKCLSLSEKTLLKRCRIADTEGGRHYFHNQGSAIVLTAHFGNWEWAGQVIGLRTPGKIVQVVYLRLKNELFNNIMREIRTRHGNKVVHMEQAFRQILKYEDQAVVSCFLADQTPQPHQIGHWSMFFNRMTPFFTGPEKIAMKLQQPVYFGNIIKTGRGRYRIELDLITDNASATADGYITETYSRMLEKAISRQPSTWLWSHRRWKHRYEQYAVPA